MNIVDIINKKVNNEILSYDEIKYAVSGYLDGSVKDYQMSSLLMAILLNGMIEDEVYDLTDIMINSGNVIDLSSIEGNVVDKHSTGGVGDKTTLVLAPLLAACGCKVAKMSGRGLGYTGGTIDKLESINGFNITMNFDSFVNQVNNIGVAIVGQMENLVPADKKIYALRDVTGTVASTPLIASSIMSKKIASGANKIIIDVKIGSGALMKNIEDARELSKLMIKIGKKYNREVICFITEMDIPLGNAVGNSLEVIEAIDTLKGNGPKDLTALVMTLASHLISIDKNISLEEATRLVIEKLKDGSAYDKFVELVKAQKGDIDNIKVSDRVFSIKSNKTGFIKNINALKIGMIAHKIGAGRTNKDDIIDSTVGIVLSKKIGDYVVENEEIARVYLNKVDLTINEILECFDITNIVGDLSPLIKEIVR